jgi:hypothetical protein
VPAGDAVPGEDAAVTTAVGVLAAGVGEMRPGAGAAESTGSAIAHSAWPASGCLGVAVTVMVAASAAFTSMGTLAVGWVW